MRKTFRLPKRVKGSARANTPRTRSIHHRGLSNRPNSNNIDKYSSPFSLSFSFSRSLGYSPNVISPTRIQKERRADLDTRNVKGIPESPRRFFRSRTVFFLKKTVAVPARGIPPPVLLFSADFREATVFDSTSAGGAAWRYAMRISNRRDATRRETLGLVYLLARYVYYLVYHAVLHTLLAAWRHCSENQEMCHRQRG